ncbi:MAG: GyrI-like domain-containing protein [Candidatus Brocadiaceae bacterium]|nr:GyrI-like domain-containing protein [Candidatus Brocadiaceae bacterium]
MLEVQIKELEPITVMSLPFTGPYDQALGKLEELMSWLLRAGHPYSGKPFGCFYDDPAKVPADQLRAEVCLPIEETCQGEEEIVRKVVPGGTMASAMFTGDFSNVYQAYVEIFEAITARGYKYRAGEPTREVYLTMYEQEEESAEPAVEILVPVE